MLPAPGVNPYWYVPPKFDFVGGFSPLKLRLSCGFRNDNRKQTVIGAFFTPLQTEQIPCSGPTNIPAASGNTSRIHISLTVTYWARVHPTPLVAIGINPSTAQPECAGSHLESVLGALPPPTALTAGSCSALYPQRADPNDMNRVPDRALCVTKTCAGSKPFWPRPNPPCGRRGAR